jgi:isoamylase
MFRKLLPGKPYPLGATWDGHGVNFAIYSEDATGVELCLFASEDAATESIKVPLPESTGFVWHGYLLGAEVGLLYGYRVYGPYEPQQGHRFNPHKLLVDPYARALKGNVDWKAPLSGYRLGDPAGDLSFDEQDDAWGVPLGIVIDPDFDWEDDRRLEVPWHETIIYETHVKGLTKLHPEVPEEQRGTYAGLAAPPVIEHLRKLGVTAVELLPVHAFVQDGRLAEHGLRNYWGYNTLGYFAPEGGYSSSGDAGGQVSEFKAMVKALHRAGIEVILDVVYNHTCEANERGPTLCYRGIDNRTYYRAPPDDPRHYLDFTGTGNTLNVRNPQVLQLIMDSLRYWVGEMHVDGFRFDLAATLARGLYDVDRLSAFFDIIHQDPLISRVKLIAEPWDVGEGGYQVGNFPSLWTEWNGRYRDTVRGFWRGDEVRYGELAFRLTGSSDLYERTGRRPFASINFVTAHDGFTLRDLVSYNEKHNQANGEDNRDGSDYNLSWNCGAEGPTEDPAIDALRLKQQRNFLATLVLSQGVPMLLGGDEIGRSQQGNNNAYCQDNETSWYAWPLSAPQQGLLEFTRHLIELRKNHPVLRRRRFFQGRRIRGADVPDLTWFRPDGKEMTDDEWDRTDVKCFGLRLGGTSLDEIDEEGEPVTDDNFLLLLNSSAAVQEFILPASGDDGNGWEVVVDTAVDEVESRQASDTQFSLAGRSLILLRQAVTAPGH